MYIYYIQCVITKFCIKTNKNTLSIMLPLARIGETLGEDIANYFIILGLMLFAMLVYALFSKKDEK